MTTSPQDHQPAGRTRRFIDYLADAAVELILTVLWLICYRQLDRT